MAEGSGARKRSRTHEHASEERRTRSQSTKKARQATQELNRHIARSLEREIEDIVAAEEREDDIRKNSHADNNMATGGANEINSFNEMAALLKSELKKMPTTEYLDQQLGAIDRRSRKNEEAILQLRNTVSEMQRRQDESLNQSGRVTSKEDEEFDLAVRSLKIWPILGKNQHEIAKNLDDFLLNGLLIESLDGSRIIYDNVQRIDTPPNTRQHNEVLVTFRESHMRDTVLSYAKNLHTYVDPDRNPTAGLRMYVPQHLLKIYKNLDTYGYYLKQKFGQGTRRIVKFDIAERSLFLTYKLPNTATWRRISPALANTFREREEERSMLEFSNALSPPQAPSRLQSKTSPLTEANRLPLGGPQREITRAQKWNAPTPSTSSGSTRSR